MYPSTDDASPSNHNSSLVEEYYKLYPKKSAQQELSWLVTTDFHGNISLGSSEIETMCNCQRATTLVSLYQPSEARKAVALPGRILFGKGLAIRPSVTHPATSLSLLTWLYSHRTYSRDICSLPSGLQSSDAQLDFIPALFSNQYK